MFPTDNNFESEFTFENPAVPLSEEPPFNILMLGNWSGNAPRKDLHERRPINIDRDNFDEIFERLGVELQLDLHDNDENVLRLEFQELDDFHPDNLFRKVSLFSDLRDVRRRLLNSDSFNVAAGEVRSWFTPAGEKSITDNEIEAEINDSPPIDSDNLLDMILTEPNKPNVLAQAQITENAELGRFISKIVSPHLIKIDENEQTELIAAVDEIISELMRAILHHSDFQALESAWRGLYFLVRRIETSADLKVFILDISKDELENNLKSVDNLSDSLFYHLLNREPVETINNQAFAVVGGNFSFGLNVNDVATLLRIAKISAVAEAPFVSYIRPEIFGFKDFSDNKGATQLKVLGDSDESKLWMALRSTIETKYLGLSPTRFLVRLPYGESSDSTELFSFEEFTENNSHEKYLWVNPCFAIILLLAQSFRQHGWDMKAFLNGNIENLPIYTYTESGETKIKPCAETLITENSLETILTQGLMPLISYKDSDKIRLIKAQSISSSMASLGGKWEL